MINFDVVAVPVAVDTVDLWVTIAGFDGNSRIVLGDKATKPLVVNFVGPILHVVIGASGVCRTILGIDGNSRAVDPGG